MANTPKKLVAKWDKLLLFPIAALLAIIGYFAEWISSYASEYSIRWAQATQSALTAGKTAQEIFDSYGDIYAGYKTGDSRINLVFMIIGAVLMVLFLLDLLFRHNVSHILLVLCLGVYVFAYALAFSIFSLVNKNAGSSVFFILGTIAVGLLIYFFVKKALDGDADWKFMGSLLLSIVFLFFGEIANYTIFDAYGHQGDGPFWGCFLASRIVLYLLIIAASVCAQCDYDPNPIKLDEFGNPIDDKIAK